MMMIIAITITIIITITTTITITIIIIIIEEKTRRKKCSPIVLVVGKKKMLDYNLLFPCAHNKWMEGMNLMK